ncbi:ABC transporter permease subunit [Amycolatopsis sp. NPDC059021]|uniref:ABC transporter permease subunit n=1 Tax=Amycolatopsis sp. NPDC059021 TaxID=3346704 RepID=UPI003670EF91
MGARTVLLSEWTKIRSVRSTKVALLANFLLGFGISMLFSLMFRNYFSDPKSDASGFDAIFSGLGGLLYTQIALVVFGVLVVSAEYSMGTIRASLAAVPRRGLFYAGKVMTGTAVAFGVSVVTVFVTFFASQATIGHPHSVSLGDPGVTRAVVGLCLYMTLISMFSMGVATMLRSSTFSLGILIPLFFIVSRILANIPGIKVLARYLPDQAGQQVMYLIPQGDSPLSPWGGLLVLVGWTVAALAGGYLVFRTRDA